MSNQNKKISNVEALRKLSKVKNFLPNHQGLLLFKAIYSSESEFVKDTIDQLSDIIDKMPEIYETDGQGDDAIAYLHYFSGSCDFFITEKDINAEQSQAFGLASCDYVELGYISIKELIEITSIELDLYFQPLPLSAVRAYLNSK